MRKVAFALLVVALPVSAIAETDGPRLWHKCSETAQCVLIEGICGKTAVHWAYKEKALAHYAQSAREASCPQTFWKPSERVVRCHLGRCDTIAQSAAAAENKQRQPVE